MFPCSSAGRIFLATAEILMGLFVDIRHSSASGSLFKKQSVEGESSCRSGSELEQLFNSRAEVSFRVEGSLKPSDELH